MATGSGAFSAKAGFNQSGGGLYIVFGTLTIASSAYTDAVVSGSGGSFTTALPVLYGAGDVAGATTLAAGVVLKDMGKTVVVPVNAAGAATGSTGTPVGMRTFRKFQVVGNTATAEAAFGLPSTTANDKWGTFYLETSRESQDGTATRPQIARYF